MKLTPQSLRESRKSYTVILQGIIREFSRNEELFFFLVEGKDAAYYRPRISAALSSANGSLSFKNCDGKGNVKELADAIRSNSSLSRLQYIIFFDRDYENDDYAVDIGDAFVTDGYSIENYYTTEEAVSAAVRSLFFSDAVHTEDDEKSVEEIIQAYIRTQEEAHREIALFNYWAWSQRHSSRKGKLNLDAFSLKDFININFAARTAKADYDLTSLNALAPEREPVTTEEIDAATVWFSTRSPQLRFRGKQEAEFLLAFLQWLVERSQNAEPPFKAKRKCSARLSKKEFVAELSPYADTPSSLATFLAQRKSHLDTIRA